MKKILTLAFVLLGFCFVAQTNVKHVDANEFKKWIDEKKGILIDLRTNDELQKKGMIKGAIQIDYFDKSAESRIGNLDKSKTYLIYCAGGGRSGECAELMTKLGFKMVIDLEKGFDDWKRKGFEVVNKQ
jgi:rhodanese-related sulfurtransferase